MESNRKRRGFLKGNMVMSIYKATKPSSTAPYSSKVKPSPYLPQTVGAGGGGFIVNQPVNQVVSQAKQIKVPHHVDFIVNQEQVVPQSNQKVSFLLQADGGGFDSYGIRHDNLCSVAVDENVDSEAGIYISTVKERFRLHRIN